MSITGCVELNLKGARSFERSFEDWDVAKRTYLVTSDSTSETEAAVLSGAVAVGDGLPSPRDLFPGSTAARAHKFTPIRNEEDRLHWLVIVDYKSKFSQEENDRAIYSNPTDRPAIITGTSRTVMRPVRKLLRAGPYQNYSTSLRFGVRTAANSAMDMLDPPLEIPVVEWELHWQKNVISLPDWFGVDSGYENGVNSNDQPVTIRAKTYNLKAGCACIGNFQFSETKTENGYDFITIGWDVICKQSRPLADGEQVVPSPWDIEILDAGMRTRKIVNTKLPNGQTVNESVWEDIKDSTGRFTVTSPVPFDGRGNQLKKQGSADLLESDLSYYLYRPNGKQVDFSQIIWT